MHTNNGRIIRILSHLKLIIKIVLYAIIFKTFIAEMYVVPSGSMDPTLLVGDYILVSKFSYRIKTPDVFPFTNIQIPFLIFKGLKPVQRGDIAVFIPPKFVRNKKINLGAVLVKRCIGLSGDTIEICNDKVYVNQKENKPPVIAASEIVYATPKSSDNFKARVPMKGDTVFLSIHTNQKLLDVIQSEGHSLGKINDGAFVVDGKLASYYCITRNYLFMMGDNRSYSVDSRYYGFVPEENLIGNAFVIVWSSAVNLDVCYNCIRWSRILKTLI